MFKWLKSLFAKKRKPGIRNPEIQRDIRRDRKDNMRKVCANCRENYIDGDRYCRFCGAPMGTPDYIEMDFARIYGPPPVKRMHTCRTCGYRWTTVKMLDRERWCPRCGGPAPAVEIESGR